LQKGLHEVKTIILIRIELKSPGPTRCTTILIGKNLKDHKTKIDHKNTLSEISKFNYDFLICVSINVSLAPGGKNNAALGLAKQCGSGSATLHHTPVGEKGEGTGETSSAIKANYNESPRHLNYVLAGLKSGMKESF
jgi:hypothetical protein